MTGAATTLLLVYTAAASKRGPMFWIIVRSSAPLLFNPAAVAPPINPSGSLMIPIHRESSPFFDQNRR